jgi:hypothetical protein
VYHFHNVVNVLVRLRLLLRQTLAALGHGDDAAGFKFLVDLAAGSLFDRSSAAHGPARSVTRRAERALHTARSADKHPRCPTHVAGDNDRLARLLIRLRQLRMARRERTRRPFAMDPHLLLLAVDGVLFQLGDIVGHIVNKFHV